jgi:hypothetical protein
MHGGALESETPIGERNDTTGTDSACCFTARVRLRLNAFLETQLNASATIHCPILNDFAPLASAKS